MSALLLSGFSVVLDANVIYNGPVRDTILRAFAQEMYRGYWSTEIIDEAIRNLIEAGRMTKETAQHLEEELSSAFPEAYVSGYQAFIPVARNHVKDRHVLAVAMHAHAQVIVTFNLRHFPTHALKGFGIEAQHPDVFLTHMYDLAPEVMVGIVRQQAADCKRPPQSVERVLNNLRPHVPKFAGLVEQGIAAEDSARAIAQAELLLSGNSDGSRVRRRGLRNEAEEQST